MTIYIDDTAILRERQIEHDNSIVILYKRVQLLAISYSTVKETEQASIFWRNIGLIYRDS